MEGGESTIETEKQDRADQMELGFGKSIFQRIHTVWVDEGNKVKNYSNYSWFKSPTFGDTRLTKKSKEHKVNP